ncbi:MAG TPA: hypothetical protein PLI42_00615 [Candidatus Pacearchaeota archaeon]|nr:hypothetical protein [Candidatus Pacearchaeota archaeon]
MKKLMLIELKPTNPEENIFVIRQTNSTFYFTSIKNSDKKICMLKYIFPTHLFNDIAKENIINRFKYRAFYHVLIWFTPKNTIADSHPKVLQKLQNPEDIQKKVKFSYPTNKNEMDAACKILNYMVADKLLCDLFLIGMGQTEKSFIRNFMNFIHSNSDKYPNLAQLKTLPELDEKNMFNFTIK